LKSARHGARLPVRQARRNAGNPQSKSKSRTGRLKHLREACPPRRISKLRLETQNSRLSILPSPQMSGFVSRKRMKLHEGADAGVRPARESLSKMCEELREGDAVRFLREMRMMDEEQEAAEFRESVEAELERLAGPKRMKLPKALMRAFARRGNR